jgi:4a-hydroxytetrahydrobiopterin dehydratase
MRAEGRVEFLRSDGVADWVVLHGGAVAVFRTESFADAARLASAVAEVPGLDSTNAVLTVSGANLSVRLTRDVWNLSPGHAELARAISAVAAAHGAVADRSAVQEVQLAVAAKPDDLDVGFWRAVLGYLEWAPDNGIDPLGHGSTVWMQDLNPDKSLRHAMHVDVSVAHEEAERRLAAALAAGGRIVDDSSAPSSWILSDRAGNKVCIATWPDRPEEPA